MKRNQLIILIIIIIAIIAFLTNPNTTKHQEAVKESMRSGLAKSLQQNGIKSNNPFFRDMTGNLFENVLWEKVLEQGVYRNNYYLFSTCNLNYLGKNYPAGIGVFGKVFVFPQVEKQTTEKLNYLIKKGGGLSKSLGF